MKNIKFKFILVLFLFVIKTNSLLAQEDEVMLSVENPSEILKQQKLEKEILKKQLSKGKLELSGIKRFPFDNVYEINKNIKSLWIQESFELISLPEEVKKFKSLKQVIISDVGLTKFPVGFCYIDSLTHFRYDSNRTTIIPHEIGMLKNLKILHLERMPIKEFPPEICNLVSLEDLSIEETAGNYDIEGISCKFYGVHSVPKEIRNLKTLRQLSLAKNNLTEIPKEIGALNNLEGLSLRGNKLNTLPSEIWNLKNLKRLSLSNNDFKNLPEELGKLKNLEYLFLSNNKLESLPKSIEKFKSLKTMYIRGNEIPQEKIDELKRKLPNTKILIE